MTANSEMQPEVSIILPVHNQADHLRETVGEYLSVLDRLRHSFEVLLVVNASTDRSLEVSEELERSHPSVRTLHDPVGGWGRAVRHGLRSARGEVLAYTNSARTSPYTLGLLVMLALANPDYVFKANRRLRYPFVRRLGSVLYNLQCRALFGLAVWDVNGTPKVLRRRQLETLDLREEGDLIDLELVAKCRRGKLQILEVPVVSGSRHGGRSTTDLGSALEMYRGAYRLWREMRAEGPLPESSNGEA